MKIKDHGQRNAYIDLDWKDVEKLKQGETICERYNGEHKLNISVIPETLVLENWVDARQTPDKVRFYEALHEFFFELSVYTVRQQFIAEKEFNLNLEAKNPHFKQVTIYFPN